MGMKKITALLFAALTLSVAVTASADPTTTTYVEKNGTSGQDITFKDDPMTAGGIDPKGVVITVRPSAVRMMLLRPRTQFISEMLKSVENL